MANPAGEKVASGSVQFDRSHPGTLEMVQSGAQAIIDWESFSIGESELTRFVLPGSDAAVLNRVAGAELSSIYGKLESNGQVFLINPHGVLIGATGLVDCAGFLAAAFDLDNEPFLEGRDYVFKNGGDAKVANFGVIRTSSGPIFLIGPDVENGGEMLAGAGQAYMISGDEVALSSLNEPRVIIRPSAESLGSVRNTGFIEAADVHLLAGRGGYALAVNNAGRIEATGVEKIGGRIFLTGGSVASSGELKAEQGRIEISGDEIVLAEGSSANVSGERGAGEIYIGGGLKGLEPTIPHAKKTTVQQGAQLRADALFEGNGGRIVVWSDEASDFSGYAAAQGGTLGGDGGFIEVSSRGRMNLAGKVSTLAPFGKIGTLLLDPTDVLISSGALMNAAPAMVMGIDTFTYSGTPVNIVDTAFQPGGYLDSTNVTINTGNMVDQMDPLGGTITIDGSAVLNWMNPTTLTLIADNNIDIQAGATIAPSGGGAIVAQAKNNITFSSIMTNTTGSITLQAGPYSTLPGFNPTGSVAFGSGLYLNLTTGSGSFTVQGYDIVSSNTLFETNSGNIVFQAAHDINLTGDPIVARTATGFIQVFGDEDVTISPGGFTGTGAFAGTQIDIRADANLDGLGDLLIQGATGADYTTSTMGGGIFLGGNNISLVGAQNTGSPIGTLGFTTAAGGDFEIQASSSFSMIGGTPAPMDGTARVSITGGEDVLVRAGGNISFLGGSADTSDVSIVGSGGVCEVLAAGSIQFTGGSGATVGAAYISYDQTTLTAGGDIVFSAGAGGGPIMMAAENSAAVVSSVSPTVLRAGGNILCTNGPTNGMTTGYAGILDNGIGFDARAAGDIQWARSAHPMGTDEIIISAGATINPLWTAQAGVYLAGSALAGTVSIVGNGAYSVFTDPETGGIEFETVNGTITLYSGAQFADGSPADLSLDDTAVANGTRLASTLGNIQVAGFRNTNVNNTVETGGAILFASNNDMNINVPAGFITAGSTITLIVDQQSPTGNGGGFFNNFNSGVSTTDPRQRIAIYAASGPTPGGSFASIPNQVVLGNLTSVETWDAGQRLGLLSKYDTSYEDGGPVHGAGFGASYIAGNGVFSSPVIWYKAIPVLAALVEEGLEAMQQLATLMPERLWLQEFSLLVNRSAFKEPLKALMRHRWKEKSIQPAIALGRSKEYFLRTTMAGNNIRITDFYQEFEQSPFWRNPRMMNKLRTLKTEAMKP